ncbi:hypothetical protein CPB85DRAFT_1330237 [Mucidula mucida]|nr:hypothetical protein CPB85DRAFT_1330237 [Mucidula mucida]
MSLCIVAWHFYLISYYTSSQPSWTKRICFSRRLCAERSTGPVFDANLCLERVEQLDIRVAAAATQMDPTLFSQERH